MIDVCSGADGVRQVWSGVAELELQAHGFSGDEDVRENDDGVDTKPSEGLEGNFNGEIRRFANLEECMLCAKFTIFGEVAPCLSHHPDGESRNGLSAASAKE